MGFDLFFNVQERSIISGLIFLCCKFRFYTKLIRNLAFVSMAYESLVNPLDACMISNEIKFVLLSNKNCIAQVSAVYSSM
jgi:hypothetical protein